MSQTHENKNRSQFLIVTNRAFRAPEISAGRAYRVPAFCPFPCSAALRAMTCILPAFSPGRASRIPEASAPHAFRALAFCPFSAGILPALSPSPSLSASSIARRFRAGESEEHNAMILNDLFFNIDVLAYVTGVSLECFYRRA